MGFISLERPTFFLSSPGDLKDLRKEIVEMFEDLCNEIANDRGIEVYDWKREMPPSGPDHGLSIVEQIPLARGHFCKAVTCIFAERIGTPVSNPLECSEYLGGVKRVEKERAKNGERLVLDWKNGDELKGGFQLTGTVFELFCVLAANKENDRKTEIPLKILFVGDEDILNDNIAPENANWGSGKLFELEKSRKERKEFNAWVNEIYFPQVRQLRNLIVFLREVKGIEIDEHAVAGNSAEAVQKCQDFLVDKLEFTVRGGKELFKGLGVYDVGDKDFFFGRTNWIKEALRQIDDCWLPGFTLFYGIVGGSGVGKSSLMRAGVIARLKSPQCKTVIFQANELISQRNDKTIQNKLPKTALERLIEKILHEIFEKLSVDKSEVNDEKEKKPRLEASEKKLISEIMEELDEVPPAYRPKWTVNQLKNVLGKTRLVIGLDQFEELLDYRSSGKNKHSEDLESLFKFFQIACLESEQIGFIYTCQTNRLEILEKDDLLGSLFNLGKNKKVAFPSDGEIKEMIQQMFQKVDITLSEKIINKLYGTIEELARDIDNTKLQNPDRKELPEVSMDTLLPLLSLTLLKIYEYCEKNRTELMQKKRPEINPKEAFNSVNEQSVTSKSLGTNDNVEELMSKEIDFKDNQNTLFLDLQDIDEEILNVESAVTEKAEEAMEESRSSPTVDTADDVLGGLFRRLIRIHDVSDERFNLLPITIPQRGMGKLIVDKFRHNRLLIPYGSDRVRLVHESVITHWTWAKEWLEKEKKLLIGYKNKLKPLITLWKPDKSNKFFQLLEPEEVDLAGAFLRSWWNVFNPNDGTQPSLDDQLLCEFAFAVLKSAMTPNRIAKGINDDASHFLTAVLYGQKELVKAYLKEEPNAARKHKSVKLKSNAAYFAAFSDDVDVLKLVLEKGANPVAVNKDGWQPIHVSANLGNIEMLDLLVRHKAKPIVKNALETSGATVLHIAAANDRLKMLRHLLESYAVDPNVPNADGWTSLHTACYYASSEIVQALLDQESIDISLLTTNGWTALHFACRYGNPEKVRALLQKPSLDPTVLCNGWSPFHLAISSHKSIEIVSLLLEDERIDRTVKTPTDKSLVEYAIDEGGLEILKTLLNDPFKKVNADTVINDYDDTPLFKVCVQGKTDFAQVLIENGADVNRFSSSRGQTPFLFAAESGDFTLLKLMIPGANFSETDQNFGRTALHLAALKGHARIAKTLMNYIQPTPELRDFSGLNPLHLAVESGSYKTAELFLESEFGDRLLAAADKAGRKLPHIAATHGYVEFLSQIGERFDAKAKDEQGMNSLHYAALFGQTDFVKRLLEIKDLNPNKADKYGWTPLHFGAQKGHTDVARLLLADDRIDASVVSDKPRLSPLEVAAAAGQTEMIELLIPQNSEQKQQTALLNESLFLAVKNAQFETASMLLTFRIDNTDVADDHKELVANAFAHHWNQFVEYRRPVPESQKQLYSELKSFEYPLFYNKRSDEMFTGKNHQAEPEKKETFDTESLKFYNYKWSAAEETVRKRLITELNLVDGKYQLSDTTTRADICSLDWYNDYRLIRLTDSEWDNPKLSLYYLLGMENDLYRLDGTSPPISEVNAKSPIKLNKENILSYLIFFCFFVRGEEGPFYILESIDDPAITELKNVVPITPSMKNEITAILEAIRPAALTEADEKQGRYWCEAVIFYSNAIFIANFIVYLSGNVEMLDDEPLKADIPFRIDMPIR